MKQKKGILKGIYNYIYSLFILGLLLILLNYFLDIFIGIFNINLGWFLIYFGAIFYFMGLGKPFSKSKESIKSLKKYVLFIGILFLVFILIGFIFPTFFETQLLNLIKELIEKTEGLNTFELIRFIILNNIQSAFFGLILGVFFGIVSLSVAVINGYVLGFVSSKTVGVEGFLILWRLLPHGIFELPAIIISLALGLKLGMFWFAYKKEDRFNGFLKVLKDSLRIFVFIIIPLLVIGGIIEGVFIILLA